MKPLRLALLGHRLDSANLGVDALARAHLAMLAGVADELEREIEATIFTWTDIPLASFAPRLSVRQEAIAREPRQIVQDWARAKGRFGGFDHCIDLSEGDSFSDIYGHRRAYIQTIDKLLMLRAGVSVTLAPMTVGPFDRWAWRLVARHLVRRASAVFVRDGQSRDYALGLGRPDVEQASDLAFLLPFDRPERRPEGRLRIGLNISQLLWSGGYDGSNQFNLKDHYPSLIKELVRELQKVPGVELHFVPHVVATDFPVEDDRRASGEMHEATPGSVLAPSFRDSIEAKGYIASLDFFMGSRMHACIAAFSSGVPVVPLAYSRKFEGLFSSLDYPHTMDLRQRSTQEVLAKVAESISQRELLRQQAVAGTRLALEKLKPYEAYVRRTLAAIS